MNALQEQLFTYNLSKDQIDFHPLLNKASEISTYTESKLTQLSQVTSIAETQLTDLVSNMQRKSMKCDL